MKSVVVTGADGFIGSHLTEMLLRKGYHVKALAQYNSFNSWGWLDEIEHHSPLTVVTGDIRDAGFCDELVEGADTIFHLAALIAIPYSYIAPESYIETNVRGTFNVCQAARKAGNIRVLHTSTSEVYGTACYVPIDENHPKQPQSPYSASKIGADAMAQSFFYTYDLPLTVVRPFNTYGPRQSARAVIPTVITQIAAGAEVIKAGDLTPSRDFNYVDDVCSAFLSIAETPETIGREINIATSTEITIGDLITLICKIMNRDVEVQHEQERYRPESSEVQRLLGDNTLVRDLTGWKPVFSLEEGLKITVEWFSREENLSKYKPFTYNL